MLKKGLTIYEKKNFFSKSKDFRNLYYTFLSSLVVIFFFSVSPIILDFKKNTIFTSSIVENNSKAAGTVVQEIQKGYMMKDRLLRPSLVGVAKKIEEIVKKEEK